MEDSLLEGQSLFYGVMGMLATRPSKPRDMSLLGSPVPGLLSGISRFSGFLSAANEPLALKGTLTLSLVQKLESLGEVTLSRMDLLNSELEIIPRALACSSTHISKDQFVLLRTQIRALVKEFLTCHEHLIIPESLRMALDSLDYLEKPGRTTDLLKVRTLEIKQSKEATLNQNFCEFAALPISQLLLSCAAAEDGQTRYAQHGTTLLTLAMAMLRCLVPDRPFDPSLTLVVNRKRYQQRKTEKTESLESMKCFEMNYSGQHTSLRIRLAELELSLLGEVPPHPPVFRPKSPQMNNLQGEFMTIITSVLNKSVDDILALDGSRSALIQQNIRQLCSRLADGYRPFADITILVVRLLQLLDLGITLSQQSQIGLTNQERLIWNLHLVTPYMKGALIGPRHSQSLEFAALGRSDTETGLYRLSIIGVCQNTDSETLRNADYRRILRDTLQGLYQHWRDQLSTDQAKEIEKSALFRYRGSLEDNDEAEAEELLEMFPTFDSDSDQKPPSRLDNRDLAPQLFGELKGLFIAQDKVTKLRGIVKEAARLMGRVFSGSEFSTSLVRPKDHLAAVSLLLDDEADGIASLYYDFYADSNLLEVKKLASLVEKIVQRFSAIRESWPEHATLTDIIDCCLEIYEFKHRDPIAKFITKTEKLHGYIYEWQTVASKEYSAVDCYNELTSLLISWRRLELSTWSRLLDIENEKCERAAEGWWFVAYEVIIATPLHLVQNGQDLASHTQDLISTLEKFLTSTPIGQYLFRLQLVEWFTSLLALYSSDFPSLSRLLSALQNLARHYKPYALALKEQLENGRKTLEKDLKQEILLSSWKDTNITALRESARRSHHKLFKIVRKYRALLGQISDALIAGGLPAPVDLKHTFHVSPNELMVVSSATLNACLAIPGWESKPGRFRDPENTIGTMRDVYQSCFTDFDVSQELNAFVRDVVESIDDFKVQTPTTFSEETKEEIQHLKVQKRRFYADKLRDLRHMGFRSNLGTDLLEKQRLSASILATTPVLWSSQEFHRIESAECYFHRFLDLVPKARQAARDYSEDLSNVEVGRSAGFVESILARILNQRKTLSPALTAVDSLTRVIGLMNNVSDVPSNELGIGSIAAGNQTRLQSLLRWLPTLLGLSVTILKSHAKHATIDSSEVLKKLESLKAEIEGAQVAFESLPQLPRGLTSNLHERTVLETQDLVMRARKEVAFIIETRPDLEFALDQILPWTKIDTSDTPLTAEAQYPMSLQDFDTALFSAMDKMFIVLQRVSLVLTACPSATSNASWLVETDNLLSKAMAELRMDKITDSFAALLDKIRYLSGERRGDLGLIIAVLSTMSPILHQYRQICADLIQRFICMHREICKLGYVLTSSFVRVASQGFCNPPEASEEKGESGKLERGTGLGEGEGAEDISKDVQDDEDLSDLAQQKSEHSKEKDETDPAQDAVNMDNEDLEADVEGSEQKDEEEDKDENGSELENEDDLDEEVGSVDGWDESAVDEKLWDGENKPEQKDTENEEGKGNPSTDEQAAAPEKKDADAQETHEKETESDNEGSEAPDAEPEGIGREDIDVTGPQAKEEEILDLPDDMELDEQDKGAESDLDNGMDDDFPDDDMGMEEQKPGEEEEGPDIQAQDQEDDEMGVSGEPQDLQAEIQPENESDAFGEEKEEEIQPAEQVDEQSREADVAQSEAVSAGVDNEQTNEKATSGESAADERSQENTKDNQNTASAAEGGDEGETSGTQAGGEAENAVEDSQVQAFKKLGDILEQWHRSQREIQEASQKEDNNKQDRDINMEEVDFEHLGDEEDTADTQALGQASEEQVKNVDQKKAVESNEKPENNDIFLDADDAEMEETSEALEDLMQLDSAAGQLNQMQIAPLAVSTRDESLSGEMHGDLEATDNIEDVDRHLSAVRLSSDLPPLTSPDEARRLWSHYESVTHDLALSLTEQLRLILAPTMATKLRGDFRTGKRLNIKRIIPYIASQYKRDKIWMRRSVPSKRNYQIMLAVDDSKSMLESASGQLAFETLALIARSLSMLEAGDLCIVSFGNEEHIRVAHEFGKPFSSEAGMQVFQQFSYKQTGTNVKRLVEESIALFRDARAKRSSSSGNADLWQLQLIISDGICEDHDDIRRLLRQAHEERIMIVFIVVDAVKEESGSIMNLTQATFEADESGPGGGKWKMKRYLEGFPFPYYLIVRNVQELPSVLSLALKQWFAEVVELSS